MELSSARNRYISSCSVADDPLTSLPYAPFAMRGSCVLVLVDHTYTLLRIVRLSRAVQLLYVANLHLEGSPYRPNDRISQTRSVLQRLEAHQRQYGIVPSEAAVVVCGDFNSGRHEMVCHFLHR